MDQNDPSDEQASENEKSEITSKNDKVTGKRSRSAQKVKQPRLKKQKVQENTESEDGEEDSADSKS